MSHRTPPQFLFAFVSIAFAATAFGQTTYTWSGATGGAWLTPGNWSGGVAGTYAGTSAAPGAGAPTDIALFNNATANIGIDMGLAGGLLSLGAINFQSPTALTVGNSSAATPGTFQLNGATIAGVPNTLVFIGNTGVGFGTGAATALVTIANTAAGGASTTALQLGATNGVFNVYGDNALTHSLVISATNITEAAAGSGFTVQGGGNVTLAGTAANTFTGAITVANGRLQVTNPNGLRATAGTTTVQNGGTLYLNAAMTTGENISIAGNGFTELNQPIAALRIGNFAVNLNGTLTLTGDSRVVLEGTGTTTVNGVIQETGGARALEKAGGGTLALLSANTYTGPTTLSLGTINLTGANGALASQAISVANAGTFTLTNATGANNANRLPDSAAVNLNNGTFNFAQNNTDAINSSETAGALTATGFLNTVNASQAAAGQTSTLTFASLARSGTGGVNFTGTNLGVDATNQIRFTTAPTLDPGGLIGSWALYNATATAADFATYGANGVAVANSNTDTTGATWRTTSNLKFASGTINIPATGQVNSLNLSQTAATTVNLNGFTGRLGSGGILVTGAFASTISNGNVTAGQTDNTPAELLVTVLTNTSTISANIINNGTGAVSLTKLGTGTLALGGTNTFSGPVVSTGGTLQIDSDAALGAATSVTMRQSPGTTTFALNGGRNVGTGVTLSLESLGLGGIVGSAAAPIGGVVGRAQIQALGAGTTNTWNGTIALSGNNFPIATAAAGITLNLNGPIVAGASGFQGVLLVRGGGNTNVNGPVNLPNGGIGTTDGGTVLTINQPSSGTNNWASTNAYAGTIQLGANNVLPPTAPLFLGQNQSGNLGTFSMNGFNATVAGLNITPGSTGAAASQIVQNNAAAGSNSVLTFAGNATPSTFAGTIRDGATAGGGTLALNTTAGTLTLSGTGNTFSGGTTVGQASTLFVTNASGSATGTGPVTVSGGGGPSVGGTLGGTGSIGGPVTVATLQGGGVISPGVGGVGTLTLGGGLALHGIYTADVTAMTNASDLISVTGNVDLTSSFLFLPNTNTYAPSSANVSYTLMTFTGSRTGILGGSPPPGYSIVYTGNAVLLVPVPEPAAILALSVSTFGLIHWIRRRRQRGAADEPAIA